MHDERRYVMERPVATILSFLIIYLLANGCSAAREIPTTEIPRFTSVVDLYEAKYRVVHGNVSLGEVDLVLRKKLFHLAAEHSTRLAIHHNFPGHRHPPSVTTLDD